MATASRASQSFARLALRSGSVIMSPTSDYREVSDDVALKTLCGSQVLVPDFR